jgi:UDP-N-acetylglucosamine/UDP-N-acetylgalactosamine diphosphorylase
VRNNIVYLANLVALEAWYRHVRKSFFERQDLGPLVYEGALNVLSLAIEERTKQLAAMAEKVPSDEVAQREFREKAGEVCALFESAVPEPEMDPEAVEFLTALKSVACSSYINAIQNIEPDISAKGCGCSRGLWTRSAEADSLLPSVDLYYGTTRNPPREGATDGQIVR